MLALTADSATQDSEHEYKDASTDTIANTMMFLDYILTNLFVDKSGTAKTGRLKMCTQDKMRLCQAMDAPRHSNHRSYQTSSNTCISRHHQQKSKTAMAKAHAGCALRSELFAKAASKSLVNVTFRIAQTASLIRQVQNTDDKMCLL